MWFAAIAAGLALAIVVLTPGGPKRLWRSPILSVWMLAVAVALQLIVAFVDFPADRIDDLGFGLLMASYALLLAFCFVNIRLRGMWLIALGIALNTAVVGLNQGMPTPDTEHTTRGGETVDRPIERTVKQRPESDDDLLGFPGDVIEIPDPIDNHISIGDIVIAAGGIYCCFRLTRRPRAETVDAALPPEAEFAEFWGVEAEDERPTEEIAALLAVDLDAEEENAEPEPALLVWHDPKSNGARREADAPPVAVEAGEIEAGDGSDVDEVIEAEVVEVEDDHPLTKLDFDDDELERKLAASENDVTALKQNRRPQVLPPIVPPTPPAPPAPVAPVAPPAAPPKPAPAAAHADDTPADDQPDDPLAVELEKLFARLSRGPGEHEG